MTQIHTSSFLHPPSLLIISFPSRNFTSSEVSFKWKVRVSGLKGTCDCDPYTKGGKKNYRFDTAHTPPFFLIVSSYTKRKEKREEREKTEGERNDNTHTRHSHIHLFLIEPLRVLLNFLRSQNAPTRRELNIKRSKNSENQVGIPERGRL